MKYERIPRFCDEEEEYRILREREERRRSTRDDYRRRCHINAIDRTSSCVVECSMKAIMHAYDDWRESSLEP